MYTKVFVSMMVILCFLWILTGCILYFGFDPMYHPTFSLIMMGVSVVLTGGSLVGLILLLIKKILSRGFLYPIAAFRSFRHGILIVLYIVSAYIFSRYGVLSLLTWFLLLCIIFLLELILTKIEDV